MSDEITVALTSANLPSHEAMQAGIRAELARWDDDDGTHAAEVRYRAMVAVDASALLRALLTERFAALTYAEACELEEAFVGLRELEEAFVGLRCGREGAQDVAAYPNGYTADAIAILSALSND